jgi:hypothetical protein
VGPSSTSVAVDASAAPCGLYAEAAHLSQGQNVRDSYPREFNAGCLDTAPFVNRSAFERSPALTNRDLGLRKAAQRFLVKPCGGIASDRSSFLEHPDDQPADPYCPKTGSTFLT